MRVIAGSAKGMRLGPVPPGVRPVSDRAREGLFSSLALEVPEARVLDLFSGTGAMGIEALSRGAAHAVFVDRAYEASAAVHDNLDRIRLADRATVVTQDAAAFLAGPRPPGGPFDLVILDPPYDIDATALEAVLAGCGPGWLSDQGWTVVLTRGIKSSTPVIPVHWAVARQLRYGDSLVILYREVSWA
jgi:16S rRNA (guanine966-N2)-methyltransferase